LETRTEAKHADIGERLRFHEAGHAVVACAQSLLR
jgi:hypothetical protein